MIVYFWYYLFVGQETTGWLDIRLNRRCKQTDYHYNTFHTKTIILPHFPSFSREIWQFHPSNPLQEEETTTITNLLPQTLPLDPLLQKLLQSDGQEALARFQEQQPLSTLSFLTKEITLSLIKFPNQIKRFLF